MSTATLAVHRLMVCEYGASNEPPGGHDSQPTSVIAHGATVPDSLGPILHRSKSLPRIDLERVRSRREYSDCLVAVVVRSVVDDPGIADPIPSFGHVAILLTISRTSLTLRIRFGY